MLNMRNNFDCCELQTLIEQGSVPNAHPSILILVYGMVYAAWIQWKKYDLCQIFALISEQYKTAGNYVRLELD